MTLRCSLVIAAALLQAQTPPQPPQMPAQAPQTATPPATQTPPPCPPPATPRPAPPTRDPRTPGYVDAKELPDGAVPPSDADGDFIIGPAHAPAPGMTPDPANALQGTVYNFTMESKDS